MNNEKWKKMPGTIIRQVLYLLYSICGTYLTEVYCILRSKKFN